MQHDENSFTCESSELLSLFAVLLISVGLYAQNAVNADGSIKLKGNVAILSNARSYSFVGGLYQQLVDETTLNDLKTSTRALAIQKFSDYAFGVVNRDDEATAQVQSLLKENKLEDYLDGFSVQAKGQGADYLFLIDITIYSEDNNVAQIEVDTRLMNISTNFGYHNTYRSGAVLLKDENDMREKISRITKEFSASLDEQITTLFPEQYFIANANGKKCELGGYQANGKILTTDKFYAFKFTKTNMKLGNDQIPLQVLSPIAIGENPSATGTGYVQVKTDKAVTKSSDIVFFRNVEEPLLMGSTQIPITFIGLDYDLKSYNGLIKNNINNAVFSAITKHPGLQLIESDLLPEIKKERELQKGEEFIDGHVVEQMKAFGAVYLVHLEDFARQGTKVSLKISLISVAENKIMRTINVESSFDNIANEMYKQICERFTYPCVIKMKGSKELEMSSVLSLRNGNDCILSVVKQVKNPVNGSISYTSVDACKLSFKEYAGNKSTMTIKKVMDKEAMNGLEAASANRMVFYYLDSSEIESNTNEQSQVQEVSSKNEKPEKKKKGNSFWNSVKNAGKSMLKNTSIQTK